MIFLVQHRAPNGSVVDLKITAKNREECFTFLTEKGIVAISVSELKNAKKSSYNTASRYLGIIKYALFFIGALCIPLAFLIFSKTPKNQVGIDRELKRKNIKINQNAHVKHMRPNSIVSNQSDAAFVNISTNNYRSSRYPSRHPPNHPAVTNVRKKAIFKTGLEQVIGLIFNTELGSPPPFLPAISSVDSERLAAILLAKNPSEEMELDAIKQKKEIVESVKKELLQYIKDGGKPSDFLGYYHAELKKAFIERQEAQKLVIQALREDQDTGLELAKEINFRLSEKGIKKVFIPPKYKRGDEND